MFLRASGFVFGAILAAASAVAQQPPQTCQTAAGNWYDPVFGFYWSLQQNGNQVTGSVTRNICWTCWPQCPVAAWPVIGTFSNGQVVMTGTDPNGGVQQGDIQLCAAWITYTGSVSKPGCHTSTGSLVNSRGQFFFDGINKPCDVPTGEITEGMNWLPDAPFRTAYQWRMTLQPTSINFAGRTVSESSGSAVDYCYQPGLGTEEQTGTSGGSGNVANGNYFYDNVGWTESAVQIYRAAGRAPCEATFQQPMTIDCATSSPVYRNNALAIGIQATTVSSSRAGNTVSRSWP